MDWQYILNKAKDCKIAYKKPEEIRKVYKDAEFFEMGSAFCFCYIENNIVKIAIRGTNDIGDLVNDVEMELFILDGQSKVHFGAWKQTQLLINSIRKYLSCHIFTSIELTGHSLGGQIALLLAFLLKDKYKINNVYTFGAPKVGNITFANTLNNIDVIRVERDEDPFTRLPLHSEYVSIGRLIKFNNTNTYLPNIIFDKLQTINFTNHFTSKYIEDIQSMIK